LPHGLITNIKPFRQTCRFLLQVAHGQNLPMQFRSWWNLCLAGMVVGLAEKRPLELRYTEDLEVGLVDTA
jgi:hypothetical protein